MDLVSSPWQVVTTTLVFLFGLGLARAAARWFDSTSRRAVMLYLWHTCFCVVYALYVNRYGGDALHYYSSGLRGDVTFSLGTAGVSFITVFFASVLGLSFLGTFFAYNMFGFLGLMAFDASLRSATAQKSRYMRRFATLIVLLPSVSFWSSAIGKDALSFMATGLMLWAALNPARRTWLIVLSVTVMLAVRPHIAGMMVLALAASYLFSPRVPWTRRLLVGSAAIAACVILVPFALQYAGVGVGNGGEINQEELSAYIEQRQQVNQAGAGGIDITQMSLPMQLFTYLFRPLPFEAFNAFALAASVDNIVLLSLFVLGGWQTLVRRRRTLGGNRLFMWLYACLAWMILAMTSANLGISLRQKWMFAPMLIFLLISMVGRDRRSRFVVVTPPLQHATPVLVGTAADPVPSPRMRKQ